MIYLVIAVALLALMFYAIEQNLRLDVATGRRDSMSLRDDYGSNRGYHWPWSPIIQACAVGVLVCFVLAISS